MFIVLNLLTNPTKSEVLRTTMMGSDGLILTSKSNLSNYKDSMILKSTKIHHIMLWLRSKKSPKIHRPL